MPIEESEESIAERLSQCSEDLSERAVSLLKEAMRASDDERAQLVAREKKITRARRAVEKAVSLLASSGENFDE
jgi:hypothetical protein